VLGRADERELGKLDMFQPKPGDVVTIMTPGGGGYGDPLERPAQAVREDVLDGYVGREAARRDYGVVLAGDTVDEAATARLRARIAAERGPVPSVAFGPERDAWEAVFDDATMLRLNALLMRIGAHARAERRRALIEQVVPGLSRAGTAPLHEIVGDTAAARKRLLHAIAALEGELAATAS
jgi:N-methylhydantoinase B